MEELIAFLSPTTPLTEVIERAKSIYKQMDRMDEYIPYDVQKSRIVTCENCNTSNAEDFFHDENMGAIICTVCGCVVIDNMLLTDEYEGDDFSDPTELYSCRGEFTSGLKGANNRLKRLNNYVEANLNRFGRDDTVTGDKYKDMHRKEAYEILEQVKIHTTTPHHIVDRVKFYFHKYREKMYRIHKLNIALLALFYLVENSKLGGYIPPSLPHFFSQG